jgi:predicted permease
MGWLKQDIGYALRFLGKRWGAAAVAVVVMSLGISLTATMFAIIKGVVLTGPDYPDLDRIVFVQTTIPQSQFNQSVRIHDYLDWKEQQTVFEEMAAYFGWTVNLSGNDTRAETFSGARVSASTFRLLGKQALLGRVFTDEEDLIANQDIVILGYHVWVNRFDRDPDIIGKTIRANARPTTVIGIMPEGFRFPELHDMWLPLGVDPGELERRQGPGMAVIGRLSEGSTEEVALTQLRTIAARLEEQFPEANRDIVPVTELWMEIAFVGDETRGLLYTMFVAVLGVLLIACANVANLLFALTIARGKELAIRTAMGASRTRVFSQILAETVVLAAGGALVGVVLSKFSLDLFDRVVTGLGPPPWMVFELSPGVILFVVGISFAAALLSGFLPAFQATRSDVHALLQDQSRGSSSRAVGRWSQSLVVLEVALSCALLVAAGLMVRSTVKVGSSDYGIDRYGILTARLSLPGETYPDSADRKEARERIMRETAALPGVTMTSSSSNLPVMGTSLRFYGVRDRDYVDDSEYAFGGYTHVSPSFFELMDVEVVAGRGFNEGDDADNQLVMIVDERFVERVWPGQDAIGRQVRLGRSDSENPWRTVVGVVRTFEMLQPLSFAARPPEGMFVPIAQGSLSSFNVALRTAGDPLALAGPLRELVTRIDPDIPVNRLDTLEEHVSDASLDVRIIGGMFTIFGVVALILASIGLYAVMAFSVSRRTSEVGIRMALGADGRKILGLILGQGSRPVALGIVVGLGLALLLGRALATFLYNVSPRDPMAFLGIPVLLVLVSVAALLVPAYRAAGIPPVTALRDE